MPADEHLYAFVGGLHRSGTTMLARALAAHPDVSAFTGTGVPADEGQHLQSLLPTDFELGGTGRFGLHPRAHMTERSPLATEETRRILLAEWGRFWDVTRPVLVEKTPANLVRTRLLQRLFPRSRFVIAMRHPLASSLATGKWSSTRPHALLRNWLRCYETLVADAAHVDGLLLVRYEDLVAAPAEALRPAFALLGLDDPPPALPEVRAGLNAGYFERWRTRGGGGPHRQAYRLLVERAFERRARRFGYSLASPDEDVPPAADVAALLAEPARAAIASR